MKEHGMKRHDPTRLLLAGLALVAGCATAPPSDRYDELASAMVKASFREQGIAKLDRLHQDELQAACSQEQPPPDAVTQRLQQQAQASIRWPQDGRWLGDWKAGEKLAQNGRGMTWTDDAGSPSGGNCYNCHELTKAEIAHGTIGPSLYQYGKRRGVADPGAPSALPVMQYTWGKIWNAKATNACSGMPRFGHAGVLTEAQIRDLMALLLDPRSPVNE
jgi:sulfur-oxidizing protein SoxX